MELRIEHLEAQAGAFHLGPVTLTAPSGSYGVLLGAPGSGKSVLVETLCGLRRAAAGCVRMDARDVTALDPRDRWVGYVPQDYLLFPTKTVAGNILFGLRSRGLQRAEAIKDMQWVLDLLEIRHLTDRWPATLSGGEQQRVALARALAIKPGLLLLDEPVSALDEGLRERVCRDLRRIQRELKITTIHISHNQEEALAVSDWAAVLDHGELRQSGTMSELLRRPRDEKVARFFRAENIFEGRAMPDGGKASAIEFADRRIRVNGRHEGAVRFMIRPEQLHIASSPDEENALPARVTGIGDRGLYWRLELDLGASVVMFVPISHELTEKVGDIVHVVFPPDAVHVFKGGKMEEPSLTTSSADLRGLLKTQRT